MAYHIATDRIIVLETGILDESDDEERKSSFEGTQDWFLDERDDGRDRGIPFWGDGEIVGS